MGYHNPNVFDDKQGAKTQASKAKSSPSAPEAPLWFSPSTHEYVYRSRTIQLVTKRKCAMLRYCP